MSPVACCCQRKLCTALTSVGFTLNDRSFSRARSGLMRSKALSHEPLQKSTKPNEPTTRRVTCRKHGKSQWYIYVSYSFMYKCWQKYQTPKQSHCVRLLWFYLITTLAITTCYGERMKTSWCEKCWYYRCMNWMHEIRAKKPVKFANIKMSHPKSQNEPRWLMCHRLGTPGLEVPRLLVSTDQEIFLFQWRSLS